MREREVALEIAERNGVIQKESRERGRGEVGGDRERDHGSQRDLQTLIQTIICCYSCTHRFNLKVLQARMMNDMRYIIRLCSIASIQLHKHLMGYSVGLGLTCMHTLPSVIQGLHKGAYEQKNCTSGYKAHIQPCRLASAASGYDPDFMRLITVN